MASFLSFGMVLDNYRRLMPLKGRGSGYSMAGRAGPEVGFASPGPLPKQWKERVSQRKLLWPPVGMGKHLRSGFWAVSSNWAGERGQRSWKP